MSSDRIPSAKRQKTSDKKDGRNLRLMSSNPYVNKESFNATFEFADLPDLSATPPLYRTKGPNKNLLKVSCANPKCREQFHHHSSLQNHYSQSPKCLTFVSTVPSTRILNSVGEEISKLPLKETELHVSDDDSSKHLGRNSPWMDDALVPTNSSDDSLEKLADQSFHAADNLDSTKEQWVRQRRKHELGIAYMNEDKVETKLLQILDAHNANHTLYQDILNWAQEAKAEGYNFQPKRTTRKAQLVYLGRMLNSRPYQPIIKSLKLPPGPLGPAFDHLKITMFDFTSQFLSLLQDPILTGDISKMDVNPTNPFDKFMSPDGRLGAANSGSWYARAYKKCITNPKKQLLAPVVIAIDETVIAQGKKAASCPVNISTSLFGLTQRSDHSAWLPLGYIYDLSIQESVKKDYIGKAKSTKDDRKTKTRKDERYQAILRLILDSMIVVQRNGGLKNIDLNFGGYKKTVDIICVVAFIVGDMVGGDKLSGCYASYSNKSYRPCRKCNVTGSELGNPDAKCSYISQKKMEVLIANNEHDRLISLCQQITRPAFFDVDFGRCKFGVFSAAMPVESLHSLQQGLMNDCLQILFEDDISSDGQQSSLNRVCRKLATTEKQKYLASNSERGMPRAIWKDGITSLTNLTADYRLGTMFTIVVLSLTKQGIEVFDKCMHDPNRRKGMQEVYQLLLCYYQWLRKKTFWKRGDKVEKENAREAIQIMLRRIVKQWPRMRGNGWEKPKLHEQLHIPDDIERYGAPANTNTKRTENHHIVGVKKPYERTSKRREVMDYEIAKRGYETRLVSRAMYAMSYTDPEDVAPMFELPASTSVQGSKVSIRAYHHLKKPGQFFYQSKMITGGFSFGSIDTDQYSSSELMKCVDIFMQHYATEDVFPFPSSDCEEDLHLKACNLYLSFRVYTEEHRHGQIFRAHYNYKDLGRWNDWVMLAWEGSAKKEQPSRFKIHNGEYNSCAPDYGDTRDDKIKEGFCYSPAKILCFIQPLDGNASHKKTVDDSPRYAIVKACKYNCTKSSVFSVKWELANDSGLSDPQIHVVPVTAIVRHCLMIPEDLDDPNCGIYHEIWNEERWADQFHVVK